jgi:mannan endo-1,6-alpha-mannosidase
MRLRSAVAALAVGSRLTQALELDVTDGDSVREVAGTIAYGLMTYYSGNETGDVPGNLPDPYFWWYCGAMFGHLVDYWTLTGDDSYVNQTRQALVHQAGEHRDYNPRNQSLQMGNDDQGFWAMAAMSAAEAGLPDPEEDDRQYVPLVQAVVNEYSYRWDDVCDGGIRWQVHNLGERGGFYYKNTISNGCFFNLAARLGRYTGNSSYLEWAERVWDWVEDTNLITDQYEVRDGIQTGEFVGDITCDDMDPTQWSYNAGIYLHGAAVMYNASSEDIWLTRVQGLLANIKQFFFVEEAIIERHCEGSQERPCSMDELSFKGYLTRWLAHTSKLVPEVSEEIHEMLVTQAPAAAAICNGVGDERFDGHPNTACSFHWNITGNSDGIFGVGPQMSALAAIMYTLMPTAPAPVTINTGGTSRDDPTGGRTDRLVEWADITTADRVGAGFVTTILVGLVLLFVAFLIRE